MAGVSEILAGRGGRRNGPNLRRYAQAAGRNENLMLHPSQTVSLNRLPCNCSEFLKLVHFKDARQVEQLLTAQPSPVGPLIRPHLTPADDKREARLAHPVFVFARQP